MVDHAEIRMRADISADADSRAKDLSAWRRTGCAMSFISGTPSPHPDWCIVCCLVRITTPTHRRIAMAKLTDKVAIVTGASKGIGASIAKELAAAGAAVVVNYASSKEAADRLVAQIKSEGGKAVAVKANIANKADIENLFAENDKVFGRLDILVNNAGIYEFVPLEEITEEHFHRHFDLNVLG